MLSCTGGEQRVKNADFGNSRFSFVFLEFLAAGIPFKDNNAGKELSAASISRWICTTIVDSHASLQSSMNTEV